MNLALSEHLPLIASAPDGIQKLRALILELAMRGKLIPQDLNVETASEFLKRIAMERAKLEADGLCKKSKATPLVNEDEMAFKLPSTWQWVRLGAISEKLTDGSHNPPSNAGSGIPMLSSQNVQDGKIDISNPSRYLSAQDFAVEDSRTKINAGDVLLTIVASIGRSAVVKKEHQRFALQRSVAVICSKLVPEFMSLQLRAPTARRYYAQHGKGTAQKGIYLGKLGEMPMAVPPIAEQHRIVAKVDELMALCDRLESEQKDSANAHTQLIETLLDTLTQSTDATEFEANWKQIAEHFDTLFTTEASIDALQKTILQLAVIGKLVPQDQNDEPANLPLTKTKKNQARLPGKALNAPSITQQNGSPFNTPNGWIKVLFGEIAVIERGGSPRPIKSYLTDDPDGLNWIKIGDTDKGGKYITSTQEKIRKEGLSKTRMVYPGDFLLTNSMSFGRPYISQISGCIHDGWLRISPPDELDKNYLYYLLSSPFIRSLFAEAAAGAVVMNLNADKVRETSILLPPLAEQHRIVAKVDELMTVCDRFKASIKAATAAQSTLSAALIQQALEAA